jgi:DNA recombination protein RmuC
MPISFLILFCLGAAVGALIASLWWRSRSHQQDARLAEAKGAADARSVSQSQELERLHQELQSLKETQAQAQQQVNQSYASIARLETQLQEERRQGEEKLRLLNEARTQLGLEFQNLANKILEEKSQKFTEQNKTNIEQVLTPLREQLGDFRRKVEDVYEKESKDRMSLFHEIGSLKALNQRISEDAVNLANALKGNTKTQGNWGEVILERVLEESGLRNGHEYETQGNFTTEDGQRFRPDVIVHLPDKKDIVIDSKVSLTAYERYCSADTDIERQAALKEHITSLRNHVRGLSGKRYEDLPGLKTLDFIFMFMPIESAFIVAVETDRELFRNAFDQNIIIVSPSTLLASLKTVHNIWRYERHNQNAMEIADRAGALYDQFVAFEDALNDVGDKLDKAKNAYETAHKRLVSGKGNLVTRVEQIKKLGAKAKKSQDAKRVADAAEADGTLLEIDSPLESTEAE